MSVKAESSLASLGSTLAGNSIITSFKADSPDRNLRVNV